MSTPRKSSTTTTWNRDHRFPGEELDDDDLP
jgi:hypothetical protein